MGNNVWVLRDGVNATPTPNPEAEGREGEGGIAQISNTDETPNKPKVAL